MIIKGEREKMNKKLFLILCLVAAMSLTAFAFEKGVKSVGGSVLLSTTNYGHGEATQYLSLSPNFSYFVIDNLALDVSPSMNVNWAENYSTTYSFGLWIGFRYFYKRFYGGVKIYYYKQGRKGNWGDGQEVTFSLGYLKEVAKNVYLDFSMSYLAGLGNVTGAFGEVDNDQRNIAAGVGIAIFFK
jgi:hypothetical protein